MSDGDLERSKRAAEAVPRPRIQTLSDLIFGLSLSIGAISLLSARPSNLVDILGSLIGFGWSFLILALVWVRYTKILLFLPVETGAMIGVNLLLLFFVSVEPYLYNLVGSSFRPGSALGPGTTTSLYAADMGAIFLVIAYLLRELTKEGSKLVPRGLLRSYSLMAYSSLGSAGLFLVSIPPPFWTLYLLGLQLRFILWLGPVLLLIARRVVESRKVATPLPTPSEGGRSAQ